MNKICLNKIIFVVLLLVAVCTAGVPDEQTLIAVLKSNADVVEKCDACQQLRIYGTIESVDALAAVLGDERVGHAARYALEAMPYPQAGAALREAIGKTSGGIKAGLIASIGWRRDEAAVELLTPLLSDSDTTVVAATALALAKIGTPTSADILREALDQTKNAKLKSALEEAYLLCAENGVSNPKITDKDYSKKIYTRLFHKDISEQTRAAAINGLVNSYPESALSFLKMAFEEKSLIILQMAAKLSSEVEGSAASDYLANLLPDLPGPVQVALIAALAERKGRAGLPAILGQLNNDSEPVKVAALKALGEVGDIATVPLLIEHATKSEGMLKSAARRSLYTFNNDGLEQALINEYAKANSDSRVGIIKAFVAIETKTALPLLFEAAYDKNNKIRQESWKAITQLADQDNLPKLVELFGVSDKKDRRYAKRAIVTVASRNQAQVAATSNVLTLMKTIQDSQMKQSLMEILGELGDDNGLAELKKALKDADKDIQKTALRSIANWPNSKPINELHELAKSSKDIRQQIIALRGFIRMVGVDEKLSNDKKIELLKEAMRFATQVNEKRQAIAVLSGVKSYRAFEMASVYLNNNELKLEAEVAVTKIASNIVYSHTNELREALESIIKTTSNKSTIELAKKAIDLIEKNKGYLMVWQMSAPYVKEKSNWEQLFEERFDPEQNNGKELPWIEIVSEAGKTYPYKVNIGKQVKGHSRVGYCRTKLWSADNRRVRVEVGSDDGFKFWVNGHLAGKNHTARGYVPAQDVFEAELKEGWNLIMMKITQMSAGWEFSVKITNTDGSPIEKMPVSNDISDEELPESFKPNFKGEVIDVPGKLRFEKVKISEAVFEAASAFDVDKDGAIDIISGENWFAGPDFSQQYKMCDVHPAGEYRDDFSDYPMDVDGDGYTDIITGAWWGQTLRWRQNPKGKKVQWETHDIDKTGSIETTRFWDVDGDGFVEAVPNAGGNIFVYSLVRDENGNGTGVFEKHEILQGGVGHGLGFGDINGDGFGDFIIPDGWLEAPQDTYKGKWILHKEFNLGVASVPIIVHDVNGDGLADIIEGQGHGYGLNCWQQKKDKDGGRVWLKRQIEPNRSQFHDMMLADLDNDGDMELITGKRYRAHCGNDPGAEDPVGIYYYQIEDNKFKRITLDYGPPSKASGVGIYLWVADVTGNGYKDIIAPGKEGLYLFKNLGLDD